MSDEWILGEIAVCEFINSCGSYNGEIAAYKELLALRALVRRAEQLIWLCNGHVKDDDCPKWLSDYNTWASGVAGVENFLQKVEKRNERKIQKKKTNST